MNPITDSVMNHSVILDIEISAINHIGSVIRTRRFFRGNVRQVLPHCRSKHSDPLQSSRFRIDRAYNPAAKPAVYIQVGQQRPVRMAGQADHTRRDHLYPPRITQSHNLAPPLYPFKIPCGQLENLHPVPASKCGRCDQQSEVFAEVCSYDLQRDNPIIRDDKSVFRHLDRNRFNQSLRNALTSLHKMEQRIGLVNSVGGAQQKSMTVVIEDNRRGPRISKGLYTAFQFKIIQYPPMKFWFPDFNTGGEKIAPVDPVVLNPADRPEPRFNLLMDRVGSRHTR